MEAASWLLFDTSRLKFQVADPDAYFVHHLSMYEHLLHRKVGYDIAQNKTVILSKSAMKGECGSLKIRSSQEYLALIPFFGGRPPNVTANLKVASLGQGNSLVSILASVALPCPAVDDVMWCDVMCPPNTVIHESIEFYSSCLYYLTCEDFVAQLIR